MTQTEYEQKKKECWDRCVEEVGIIGYIPKLTHDYAFDCAYVLGKQEKDGIDLKKLDKMLDDALEKETKGSLNQWLSDKSGEEETMIHGWLARDANPHRLYVYGCKPLRLSDMWSVLGESFAIQIDPTIFPSLTWDDTPEPVEIIIKRKKNG